MVEPSPWRALGLLASTGIVFVVATAGGTVLGYFLDRWLGSSPWLTLIGLGLGIVAGFRELVRIIRVAERQEREGRGAEGGAGDQRRGAGGGAGDHGQ